MIPKTILSSHKQEKLRVQLTAESAQIIPNSWEVLKYRNLTLKQ